MEPSAYLNDPIVLRMNTLERGAYSTLLFALWDLPEPGVAPDSDTALRSLSRTTPEEWAQVRDAVAIAFDTESRPGFWVQRRMVETHEKQDRFIKLQKAKGKVGGKVKATNGLLAVATDRLQPKCSLSSVLGSRFSVKDKKKKTSSPRGEDDPGFAKFYSAYPRKVAKPAALRAWKKQRILTQDELDRVMAGLDRWKTQEASKRDIEFIPHPASWLNARRWEDDLTQTHTQIPPEARKPPRNVFLEEMRATRKAVEEASR